MGRKPARTPSRTKSPAGLVDDGPLSLEGVAKLADIEPSEAFPQDLADHLRLKLFPVPDVGASTKLVTSQPKGFAPRYAAESTPHITAYPTAVAENVDPPTSSRGITKAPPTYKGFRPNHLGLRHIPRTIPYRDPLGNAGPMTTRARIIGWDMSIYPWSSIGWIRTHVGDSRTSAPGGTGFMVGPNLMVTASHVMPWEHSGNCSIEFIPGHQPGREPIFGSSFVTNWRGFRYEGSFWDQLFKPQARDYVICRLGDPIGNLCGWLGTQSYGDHNKYLRSGWMSAGYPDFASYHPTVELDARIRDVDGDNDARELESVNFASYGWSGGPLFGHIENDIRAVGVCSGKETEFVFPAWHVNVVFAGGEHLVDLVHYGYANY